MAMEWTEDLSTGSAAIDDQHKELFKRIDALLEACRQGKGKAEVSKVIQFLDEYVVTHFSAEEKYMEAHHYPELARHKALHLEFIENFGDLKRELEEEGPGVHLVVKTNQMVVQWLLHHIRKVDRALGAFLKAKA
jgi:hemerythrin